MYQVNKTVLNFNSEDLFTVFDDKLVTTNVIILVGNVEEAVNVLTFLRASESEVKEEVQEYENDKGVTNMTFRELFKTSNLPILKIVGIAVCIGVGSQITGYNAIAMFLQAILVSTKTSVSPEIASVIIGVIQLLASFFTASIIDRFGRKPILSTSVIGISVGMVRSL